MGTGDWTLVHSRLSQEEKDQLIRTWLRNQSDSETELTQLERLYCLNETDILSKGWFYYQMNHITTYKVDIPLTGKLNWHTKCKCGNYILHVTPVYPRRDMYAIQKHVIIHDINLRYLMRVRNICYSCAQKRLGKGLFLQEV